MILLFKFHTLKGLRTLVTNHRRYVISSLKKVFPEIGISKSKVTASKFKKIGILPGILLQGIAVAKYNGETPTSVTVSTELHLKEQDSSFDWRLLCHLLRSEIWRILFAMAAAVAVAIINVQLPIHLGKVIDVLSNISLQNVDSSFLEQLKEPAIRLLSIYVLQAFFTFVYVDLLSTVGENLACNLKNKLFTSVMQQDLTFFDKNRTGEIIDRLTTDVQEFKSAFKLCVSQGIKSGTQILGCVISLVSISPEMTGVILLILPTCVLIGSFIGSKLRSMSRKAQDQAAWSTIQAEEVVANIRTVRAFAMEHHECEKFKEEIDKTGGLLKKLGLGIALFQASTNIFLNGIVLLTLGMGGYMLSLKKLSTGNIMSFLVAMQTIQKSLTQISLLFGYFVKGVSSGTRVFQYIKLEPTVPLLMNLRNTIPIDSFEADIKFESVSFSYPTRPEQTVLKNFTLSIPAGKVVAIVGSSGNGKSTVAALLLKFYNANEGRIEIGGRNINELDENWLRGKMIGFINQEPVLFATTIKDNIRYGNPSATDEEVYEAARLANADTFIKDFPKGYETVVGEKGIAISGGQKQRIAIARAFLKKPKILVLDEATSALDTISEQQVQKTLESVMKGKTVVVIAHRLTTIKNADIIVVLDNGVVVEIGQHDHLLKKKGFYWNLMNKQERDKQTAEGNIL